MPACVGQLSVSLRSASDAWLLAAASSNDAIVVTTRAFAGAMLPAAAESTCWYVVWYSYEYVYMAVSIVFVKLLLGYW